jgi:nicotinamide riboside transporter PnuC
MSAVRTRAQVRLERSLTIVAGALGALLLYAAWRRYVEFDLQEALGFVTGAACVWLGVKQNVWNWPLGIANNAFYVVIFVQARLFSDAGLQIVFATLGAYGWYAWTRFELFRFCRTCEYSRFYAMSVTGPLVRPTACRRGA